AFHLSSVARLDFNDQEPSRAKAPRRKCSVPPFSVGWIPGWSWSQASQNYMPQRYCPQLTSPMNRLLNLTSFIPPSSSEIAALLDSREQRQSFSSSKPMPT
ncbi:hypothetical protein J0S82_007938, partial [Galemys pyrenaicus]